MKKFFRSSCIHNADGLAAFILVGLYLFIVWQLIMSGSLLAQILAVLVVLYFVITALIGAGIIMSGLARAMIAKKQKESAPTEVSAE